jgi:hypothetical protein
MKDPSFQRKAKSQGGNFLVRPLVVLVVKDPPPRPANHGFFDCMSPDKLQSRSRLGKSQCLL